MAVGGGGVSADDRVRRLQRLVAALARASSADEVAAVTVDAGLAEAGSTVGGLWLPEDGALVAMHAQWADTDQPNRLTRFPIAANLPAAEAYRTGEAVWMSDPSASIARYPELRPPPQGYFALPLVGTGGVLGVFAGRHNLGAAPADDERTFLLTIAALCAQALERTSAYERERRAKETLEFLATATAVMVSAQDPDEVVRSLVRMAVPRLASWCTVYVAGPHGLRRAATESTFGRDPGAVPTAPLPLDVDTAVTRAFRSGAPEVVTLDRSFLRAYFAEPVVDALLSNGLGGCLVVPVRIGDESLGVLALALERDTDEFRFAATGLAARAAVALENARRHRQQRDLVRTLTEALLPSGLPAVEGYDLAARYVPSSGGVCGDWYEAEPAADGTLWVAVGDASGHGIEAASTMALVRNATIGLREAEGDPARLLGMLSRVVEHARPGDFVTAVLGTLEPGSGHLRWCSAGHPHGVVATAGGAVQELPGEHGTPLGVRCDYETNRYRLGPGDTLLLYTDGVVERRGEDIRDGIARLLDVIASSHATTAEDLAARVVEELCADPDDDCCVLIIRRLPAH